MIVWHRILCSRWYGKQENNTQNGVGGTNSLAYQLSTKRLLVKSQSNYNSQANNNNNLSRPGSGQRVSLEVEEGVASLVVAKRTIAGTMAPEDSDWNDREKWWLEIEVYNIPEKYTISPWMSFLKKVWNSSSKLGFTWTRIMKFLGQILQMLVVFLFTFFLNSNI